MKLETFNFLLFLGLRAFAQPNSDGSIREPIQNLHQDNWVASDALGRELPSFKECGPVKNNRFVGMFYFVTHNRTGGEGPFDVTKIMSTNPDNPQWKKGTHFWGESETGYYLSNERWMIKRHARLLSDAGIDVIIFDVTNDKTYPDVYMQVCEVFNQMRLNGEKTPQVSFLGSEISVNKLWIDFYQKRLFSNLWFRWKGKPLLLFGQHEIPRRKKNNDVVFSAEIQEFFSIRQSWAWTTLPWYQSCPYGQDKWPWVDHYPQAIGWHESADKAEMVPVAVAQHPLSNIGRSFHNYNQPETDKYDLTPFTDENWMLLFIDADQNKTTGWEGYDFVVNSKIIDKNTSSICELDRKGNVENQVEISFHKKGNKLMLKVPREKISKNNKLTFDFHWADNIKKIGDITEFFLNGDSAPERRANYRFF